MNEKENTARALKDQVLLISNRWCRFGVHNWTKWSEPHSAAKDVYGNPYYYQSRDCASCGKHQIAKRKPL